MNRLLLMYLTVSFVTGLLLAAVTAVGGLPALAVAGALHVATVLYAARAIGRRTTGAAVPDGSPAGGMSAPAVRAPVTLILAGVAILLVGAAAGAPKADQPPQFLFNAVCLLAGALVMTAGVVVLAARLWETGERTASVLTGFTLTVAVVFFVNNMLWRMAAIGSGGSTVIHDARERVSAETMPLPFEPSWTHFTYVWVDTMLIFFSCLVFLASGVTAISLRRAGWFGRPGAAALAATGFGFALLLAAGTFVPALAPLSAVLGIPFMACLLPYIIAVRLAWRAR